MSDVNKAGRKKTKPNIRQSGSDRVTPRAVSFFRIARFLRIRAAAYNRRAKLSKHSRRHFFEVKASALHDVAIELDNEARTLRATR